MNSIYRNIKLAEEAAVRGKWEQSITHSNLAMAQIEWNRWRNGSMPRFEEMAIEDH